jgi:hypothetical protein
LDFLLQKYESLAARKAKEEDLNAQDKELLEVIEETDDKIDQIREFTQSI